MVFAPVVVGFAGRRARRADAVAAGPVPYHLRHAAVSTWLNAGVRATQVAEWAGHSVHVLLKVYAKCIDGQDEAARRRIEAALGLMADVDDASPESGDTTAANRHGRQREPMTGCAQHGRRVDRTTPQIFASGSPLHD